MSRVFGDTFPVCVRGTGSLFRFFIGALGALLAELSRVFIFKGAWFALTLGVPGGVASRYFIFTCRAGAALYARRQSVGVAGVLYTSHAGHATILI